MVTNHKYKFFGTKHGENVWFDQEISFEIPEDFRLEILKFTKKTLIMQDSWDEEIRVGKYLRGKYLKWLIFS